MRVWATGTIVNVDLQYVTGGSYTITIDDFKPVEWEGSDDIGVADEKTGRSNKDHFSNIRDESGTPYGSTADEVMDGLRAMVESALGPKELNDLDDVQYDSGNLIAGESVLVWNGAGFVEVLIQDLVSSAEKLNDLSDVNYDVGNLISGKTILVWDGTEYSEDSIDNILSIPEELNDLDDVNYNPSNLEAFKTELVWDGSDFVEIKRQYVLAKAGLDRVGQTTVGLINQTTVLEEYLRVTIVPERNVNFRFCGSFGYSTNTGNQDFVSFVEVRRTSDDSVVRVIKELREEQKDTSGTGEVLNIVSGGVIVGNIDTSTDQRKVCTFLGNVELIQGVSYYCVLVWACSQNNTRAAIYGAEITAEEKFIS